MTDPFLMFLTGLVIGGSVGFMLGEIKAEREKARAFGEMAADLRKLRELMAAGEAATVTRIKEMGEVQ